MVIATATDLTTISPGELEQILLSHERYLANTKGGRRAVLPSSQLSGVKLANRNLSQADLSGSVFLGADISFAKLIRTNLYCCDLHNVDARYADFSHSDMRGVALNGSNLSRARLDHVDFRSGRLIRNGLWGSEAGGKRKASAPAVDFSYTSLCGASFQGADLANADFTGAIINGTHFKDADLTNAVFNGAVLIDVDLSEMDIPETALKDCVLPPSIEALAAKPQLVVKLNLHQRWIDTDARAGICGVFDGEDLRPVADCIGKFKLTAISARRVTAPGLDFSCTELQGANFEGADLRGASFEGADLRGVKLRGARLNHAKFLGADLRPLELRSGGLLECDLAGADISDKQLDEAIRR